MSAEQPTSDLVVRELRALIDSNTGLHTVAVKPAQLLALVECAEALSMLLRPADGSSTQEFGAGQRMGLQALAKLEAV